MSGIQGLSSDQQQVYNQLINDAGTVNVSRAAVDKELQVAMDAGLSFQEAAAQVRNDLPTLTPPKSSSGALGAWVGVAIEAPEGYEQGTFQYHFGTEASAEATQSAAITEDSSIGQGKYAVFFLNASSTAPKSSSAASCPGRSTSAWALSSSAWA